MTGKGLHHLAVFSQEKPAPEHLAGLATLTAAGAKLLVIHVEPAACAASAALGSSASQLRTAVAAAKELLPPLAGVLHAPVPPAEAAAAAAVVEAAQQAATAAPAAAPTAGATPAQAPPAAPASITAAGSVAAMRATILAALGSLVGEAAAAALGGDEPLMSAGLTSTLAVQLTQQLEERLGAELPGTLVFDYPSLNEMAAYLAAELAGPPAPAAAPAAAVAFRAPAARPAPALAPAAFPARPAAPAPISTAQLEAAGTALVLQQLSALLGAAAADVAPDAPFMSAGLTSTLAVQLTQRLEEAVGAELPGTLVFDYPTAAEIGGFLAAEGLLPSGGLPAAAAVPSSSAATTAAAPAGQQRALVVDLILREVASLAGGAGDVAPDAPLMSAGLTSALAVQLVSALEGAVGAELPGTLVFDYPTGALHWGLLNLAVPAPQRCSPHLLTPAHCPPPAAGEIADYLLAEGLVPAAVASLATQLAPAPAAAPLAAVAEQAARPLCAITASSHTVPGGQLGFQPGAAGNDRISTVPLERWDVGLPPADNPAGALC